MGLKPVGEIKANLGIEPNGHIQRFFTATCNKHMDKYIPMDSGALRNNKIIRSDSITYTSPYAHYQWYGKVMGPNVPIKENNVVVGWYSPKKPKTYTGKDIEYHGGGGSHWEKRMWSAEKDKVLREVGNEIKRSKK